MIIRTPTKATGAVTGAELAKANEWGQIMSRTEPIEPNRIIPAIEALYQAANIPKPRVIIEPSPLVVAMAGGFATAVLYLREKSLLAANAGGFRCIDCSDGIEVAIDKALRTVDSRWRAAAEKVCAVSLSAAFDAEHAAKATIDPQAIRQIRGIVGLFPQDLGTHKAVGRITWLMIERAPDKVTHFFAVCAHSWGLAHSDGNMSWPLYVNETFCADGPSRRWRDGWELCNWLAGEMMRGQVVAANPHKEQS